MLRLRSSSQIPRPDSVRNIIFDFGGVICNIDLKLSEEKFRELGFKGFNPSYSVEESEDVFRKLEGGKITIHKFIAALKNHLDANVTDEQVIAAWNAMILDIPPQRVKLLEEARRSYRIFILSNSNEIHYNKYLSDFRSNYGYNSFEDLFETAWFSFKIHLQKPSPEVFRFVIHEGGLNPDETLFIDDTIQQIESARNAGLKTYHLCPPEEITSLFEEVVVGEC
jgi:putative hydrolase of the HAD superfamily